MGERSRGAYGRKYVISSRALFTSVDQFSYFVLGKISSASVSQYLGPLLDLIKQMSVKEQADACERNNWHKYFLDFRFFPK